MLKEFRALFTRPVNQLPVVLWLTPVRTLLAILVSLIVSIQGNILWAETSKGQLSLDDLIEQALNANPEIGASEGRLQASLERARQAGALEDPMMMLRVQNALIRDPLNFSRDTMTAKVIGISQKLPFFGKRELMKEELGLEAEAERWTLQERRIELRRMVKETWYQLALVDRSLETVTGTTALLDGLIRLAESMYGVGKTGQQEVFQAQLERTKMEEMRIGLEQKRTSLVATLNTLVHRPPETPIPSLPHLSIPSFALSATEMERLAFEHRPVLKALQAKIDKSEASVKLAEKELYPDFTVSLEYMQREPAMDTPGDDMYGAQLSFNLPIQSDRRRAKVAEMQAEKRMAIHELAGLKNKVRQAISDGLAQLERSRRLIQLYDKGMLVQARAAAESSMAAYRTDKAKFSDVLTGRLAQFNLEREYQGAITEYQMVLAVLENVVGMPLPLKY